MVGAVRGACCPNRVNQCSTLHVLCHEAASVSCVPMGMACNLAGVDCTCAGDGATVQRQDVPLALN
jgi:hypothetical protein